MKISLSKVILFIASLPIAILVANRPLNYNDDTYNYYLMLTDTDSIAFERIEPLFLGVTKQISNFTDSSVIYFFFLFLFLLIPNIYSAVLAKKKIPSQAYQKLFPYYFLAFLLSSTWFFTSSINGIRQGIAMSFIFLSLFVFLDGKKKISIIFAVMACLTHYSSVLFVPFLLLYRFSLKHILLIFLVSCAAYPLGIYEAIIKVLSAASSIPLYSEIKYYSEDGKAFRTGFQPDLYIYTIFWFFAGLSALYMKLIKQEQLEFYTGILKSYAILVLPYLVLGFGGYSNRYAVLSWSFLPFLLAAVALSIKVPYKAIFFALPLLLVASYAGFVDLFIDHMPDH